MFWNKARRKVDDEADSDDQVNSPPSPPSDARQQSTSATSGVENDDSRLRAEYELEDAQRL
jgi:hypothetical protein